MHLASWPMNSWPNIFNFKPSKHVHRYAIGFATKVLTPNWAALTGSQLSRTLWKIFRKLRPKGTTNTEMIEKLLVVSGLVAITVIIHAAGLGVLLSHLLRST